MTDNLPMSIKDAAEKYFGGIMGVDGFRAWCERHGVVIQKDTRKHWVLPSQCQDALDRLASSRTRLHKLSI